MFVTNASNELSPPPQFADNGLRLWRAIEMGIHLPWFCATFEYRDSGGPRKRTMFTVSLDDLGVAGEQSQWGVLIDVQLVSPAWINRSGGWRMDDLKEVRSGHSPDLERDVLIFVLADDRYFMEAVGQIEGVKNQRALFTFKRPLVTRRTH